MATPFDIHPDFQSPITDPSGAVWELKTTPYADPPNYAGQPMASGGVLRIQGSPVNPIRASGWAQCAGLEKFNPGNRDFSIEVTFCAEIRWVGSTSTIIPGAVWDNTHAGYIFRYGGGGRLLHIPATFIDPDGGWQSGFAVSINTYYLGVYQIIIGLKDKYGRQIGRVEIMTKWVPLVPDFPDPNHTSVGMCLPVTLKLERVNNWFNVYVNGELMSDHNECPEESESYIYTTSVGVYSSDGYKYCYADGTVKYVSANFVNPLTDKAYIPYQAGRGILVGTGNTVAAAEDYPEGSWSWGGICEISHFRFQGTSSEPPADICTNGESVLDNTQYAYLAAEVQTLAWCWKVVRLDGVFYGFTSHDQNIVYNGVTYEAATGIVPTAVESSGGLSVDNLDVEGVLTSDRITETDLMAGKYDYAFVEVFLLDWLNPANAPLILRRGRVGEVSMGDTGFKSEIRGLIQNLQQSFGQVYSVTCRATLGDAKCGCALAGYTVAGTVASVSSRTQFATALGQEAGYFDFGVLTFTNGLNAGYSGEVRSFASGTIMLYLPVPFAIQAGDAFNVVAGCDRKYSTCRSKFSNGLNFRGEPHVPGEDFAYSVATRDGSSNTVTNTADAGMR